MTSWPEGEGLSGILRRPIIINQLRNCVYNTMFSHELYKVSCLIGLSTKVSSLKWNGTFPCIPVTKNYQFVVGL